MAGPVTALTEARVPVWFSLDVASRDLTTMLKALVLICSLTATPDLRDCSLDNATSMIRVPEEFGNPAMCFMHGQAYLAYTAIAEDLGQDDRVKVICARREKVEASKRPMSIR